MSLPSTMSYIGLAEHGGPENLTVMEGPVPQPRPGEILVRRGDATQFVPLRPRAQGK